MELFQTYTPPVWALLSHINTTLEDDELGRIFRYILMAHHDPRRFCADEHGRTPLHYAITLECRDVLEFYLQNQMFDVNKLDNLGESVLYRACDKNCLESALLLLAHGAHPNPPTSSLSPLTPLMRAVVQENIALVKTLLACGADPRTRIEHGGLLLKMGETALSLAVRLNRLTDPLQSEHFTQAQLDIIALILQHCSEPSYVFHALQHTKMPLMKQYITACMRVGVRPV